jgi:hypothetical protein
VLGWGNRNTDSGSFSRDRILPVAKGALPTQRMWKSWKRCLATGDSESPTRLCRDFRRNCSLRSGKRQGVRTPLEEDLGSSVGEIFLEMQPTVTTPPPLHLLREGDFLIVVGLRPHQEAINQS